MWTTLFEITKPFIFVEIPYCELNEIKTCVIYKGNCSCGSRYIGETKRNTKV